MRHMRTDATRFRPALEMLENRLCPAAVSALAAPTLLSVTPASSTSATLTWTNVANATGDVILLWNGTQAVPLTTVDPGVTTTTATGLPGGQESWLSVEAVNATSHAQSTWMPVTLPQAPLAGAAALTALAASTSEIDLRWTIGNGQTGFRVLQWNGTQAVTLATLPASQRHDAVTGLTPGTTYYFAVQAFNASNSQTTAWVKATTLAQPITAPTSLTATATDTSIALSWSGGQGATGYDVFEWENDQAVQVGQTKAGTTQLTLTGLTPGTGAWFYVEAFNASNQANTAWKFFATTDTGNPLPPPGNLTAKNTGTGAVQLSWTASTGAVGYWVYAWSGTSWNIVATLGTGATSANLTGLSNGVHYFDVMAFTQDAVQYANSQVIKVTV